MSTITLLTFFNTPSEVPKKLTVLLSVVVMVTEVTNLFLKHTAASVEMGIPPDIFKPASQKL